MRRALLDTDTLSYFLKGYPQVLARAADYLAEFDKLGFSLISYYEVRRGLLHAEATRKLADFEAFASVSELWPLNTAGAKEAADICAALWAQGEPLDDADVLIAGIARANRLALVTNNVDHFSRVADLDLENWLAGMEDG